MLFLLQFPRRDAPLSFLTLVLCHMPLSIDLSLYDTSTKTIGCRYNCHPLISFLFICYKFDIWTFELYNRRYSLPVDSLCQRLITCGVGIVPSQQNHGCMDTWIG